MPTRSRRRGPARWVPQLLRLATLSLVCGVLLAARLRVLGGEGTAAAARAFLASLPEDQRQRARFDFDDALRLDWHFVPRQRVGLPLGELSGVARGAARELLASALSAAGLARVDGVIELEALLRELESTPERPATWRDPGAYFLSVFGDPGGEAPWGWRLEGHHLALNFSLVAGRVAVTPAFVGANPAHAHAQAGAGVRLLGREEDLARELVQSLSAEQAQAAVVADTPPDDIFYGPQRRERLEGDGGLAAARLDEHQRQLLARLLDLYVETLAPDLREDARARLGPPAQLRFTWMGGLEPGQAHYWRIDGAHALIEWDDVQNGANHVHTVWRDLERDFGRDLLAEHRREAHGSEGR